MPLRVASHLNGNLNQRATPVEELGNHYPEFAARHRGARSRRVAGSRERHGAHETTEPALNKVKGGMKGPFPRTLLAGHEEKVALHDRPHGRRLDAGEIHRDGHRIVALEDVDRGRAFSRRGVGPHRPADVEEELANVLG